MDQIIEFFKKLFDSSDWPPRWHCGQWTEFHGWLYIISDLLIWSAYFTIPVVIIRYISKKQNIRFTRLYFLFAAFILACGATHFLDAIAFWIPAYRLSALVRFITGALSWITVFYLVKLLPVAFSLKSQKELETEIEQRKKAEEQARESEEQVQTIFDAAPDAVIVIDESEKIVKWNPRAETLFGWKENEVTGKLLSETIIPERFRELQTKVLKHFLRTGEGPLLGKIVETCAVTKDNVELDVALNIAATKKIKDRYLFIGFIRDITEQRKAELQIQKQKQDIQDFIDSMSTLSVKLATDGKILMVNKIALQASGLSMEELLGANFTEGKWWTYDSEVHSRVRDAFKNASSGIAINYDENIFVFGQVLTIEFSLIPILNPDGSVDYIVGEGRDITAQKKAEEKIRQMNADLENRVEEKTREIIQSEKKFRDLIENSADIISLTDKNFKALYRSPSAERVTGWTDEEREKFGANELFHPDDIPAMRTAMKEILKNPSKQFHLTFRHRHKKGHYIWLDGMMTNRLDDDTIKAIVFNLRDITEGKKAEELVVQSEIKYRSLFTNNPMPIWVIDTSSFKFLDVNEAAIRHYGYSREEFLSMTALDIRPESESERFLNPYQPGIWKHLKKDNSIIYVEVIGHNISFDEKPARLVLSNDVTERIKMEEMLKESFKEISDYKYALDESSILAITDQKGIIKHANDNFCNISKYSREELIGQDHRIINSGYHPKEFIRDLWVTIANGKIWKGELKNKAKDGTIYWVDTTIIPFLNAEGKPYQYVAIRADITERKKAEENIKATLKEVSDYKYALDESSIVAITDQKGIIKYVNDNFCKISKYNREELIGQDHRIINSGYHPKEFIRNLWVTIANGKIWKGELKNKAKDSTIYWVDTTIVPFLNEEDKPYQYVAIRADITDRKKAENDIRELNEELEQKVVARTAELNSVNTELEAFSYSVSHDLRAPLRNIIGFTAMLEEDYGNKLDAEAMRITSVIKSNTIRMGNLIDDLLTFSRMGRNKIVKTRIDTNKMVSEIINDFGKSHNSVIEWVIYSLPVINGDISMIRQVWINLISNAIKYSMNKPNPRIEIGSSVHNEQVIFFIKDNGVGFDEKYKHNLFKVFQRLHTADEFEGTGVGLALVEKIISKHGGKVWAEGKVNGGACFYFSLPVA